MSKQHTSKIIDLEFIKNVYIWKMRSTTGNCNFPAHLNTLQFAEALCRFRDASSKDEIKKSIEDITAFPLVKTRVASAFMYWLRPNEFQLIDRRVTAALNLSFASVFFNLNI